MTLRELAVIFHAAALYGSQQAIDGTGLLKDRLTAAAAYRLYGRGQVERWQQEGLIAASASASRPKRTFDRRELEAVAAASNRHSYLSAKER
jgi:hypothetical protein